MLGPCTTDRTGGAAGGSAGGRAVAAIVVIVVIVKQTADVGRSGRPVGLVEFGTVDSSGQGVVVVVMMAVLVLVLVVEVGAGRRVGERLFEREARGTVVFCVAGSELGRRSGRGRGHCGKDRTESGVGGIYLALCLSVCPSVCLSLSRSLSDKHPQRRRRRKERKPIQN